MSYVEKLSQRFGPDGFTTSEFRDNRRVTVARDRLFDVLKYLKEECGFDLLADITAVDYLHYPEAHDRFGVVYALRNIAGDERVYVKTYLNEPDLFVPSAYSLWKGADWMEREVFDMFGITF